MENKETFTRSPPPPLPARDPNHRLPYSQFPPPASTSRARLVPSPLFSRTTRPPQSKLHVQVRDHETATWSPHPNPSLSDYSAPSSPTTSFTSASTASSASSVSDPPLSQDHPFPPPDICNQGSPSHPPHRRLRRTKTPRKESLRDIRARESTACLQRVYEQRIELYLNGSLFPRAKWRDDLACLEEE